MGLQTIPSKSHDVWHSDMMNCAANMTFYLAATIEATQSKMQPR